MAWIIGVDEAGYGPNLGPFVMTAVACRVPEAQENADLWHLLRAAVRRHADPNDGRLLVEDSKLVYSTALGLGELERGVLAARSPQPDPSLREYVQSLCPDGHSELVGECWYRGETTLPVAVDSAGIAAVAERLAEASSSAGVEWGLVRSVVVCPARFNRLLDQWGTKSAVLGQSLAELIGGARGLTNDLEPLRFFIDKHGGRNTYTAMLQDAIPEGLVVAREEGAARSTYEVLGLKQETRLTFQPRADGEHFCVALASMVSKYLREVLMREFNAFWLEKVPGLKPTAGYPGDAVRFFEAIRPSVNRLGIATDAVWRRK